MFLKIVILYEVCNASYAYFTIKYAKEAKEKKLLRKWGAWKNKAAWE